MQFIDKTLNRVIKWENRDISISEMLELIENEIIIGGDSNGTRENTCIDR